MNTAQHLQIGHQRVLDRRHTLTQRAVRHAMVAYAPATSRGLRGWRRHGADPAASS